MSSKKYRFADSRTEPRTEPKLKKKSNRTVKTKKVMMKIFQQYRHLLTLIPLSTNQSKNQNKPVQMALNSSRDLLIKKVKPEHILYSKSSSIPAKKSTGH